MRLTSIAFKTIGLLVVYAFACGALSPGPVSADGPIDVRLAAPLGGLTPQTFSILLCGAFLFAAGIGIEPGYARRGERGALSFWTPLLLASLLVASLAVAGTVACILSNSHLSGPELGAFYAAGVLEAVLASVLAVALYFLRRPRLVYLPTLGILFAGIAALGAMFWLGNSAGS